MLLVDTNVLLAAADRSSVDHQRCAALLDTRSDLAITTPVAVECAWMIESRLGPRAEAAFVASIAAGEIELIELNAQDWARCVELIATNRLQALTATSTGPASYPGQPVVIRRSP